LHRGLDASFIVMTRPFSPLLWGLLGGTILVTSIAIYMLEWDGPDFEDVSTRVGGLAKSVYLTCIVLPGIGAHEPTTGPARALMFSWGLILVILISWYTADLASLLVTIRSPSRFSSVQNLADRGGTLCVSHPSSTTANLDLFAVNTPQAPLPSSMRYFEAQCDTLEHPGSCVDTLMLGRRAVCSAMVTVGAVFRRTAREDHSFHCQYYEVGTPVKSHPSGFAINRRWSPACLDDALSHGLDLLSESGWLQALLTRKLGVPDVSCEGVDSARPDSIGVHEMSMPFCLHALFTVCVILAALVKKRPQLFPRSVRELNESMQQHVRSQTRSRRLAAATSENASPKGVAVVERSADEERYDALDAKMQQMVDAVSSMAARMDGLVQREGKVGKRVTGDLQAHLHAGERATSEASVLRAHPPPVAGAAADDHAGDKSRPNLTLPVDDDDHLAPDVIGVTYDEAPTRRRHMRRADAKETQEEPDAYEAAMQRAAAHQAAKKFSVARSDDVTAHAMTTIN